MPARFVRWALFLSSYTPLFVILTLRYWSQHRPVAITAATVAFAAVVVLLVYEKQASRLAPYFTTAASAQSRTGEAMAYIVTYVIPFLDFDVGALGDQVALLVLLFVLGVLYVNSNLIHVNPLLNLIGYHTFEITGEDNVARMLLTRRDYIRAGEKLMVVSLGSYVLMEKPE